MSLVFIQSSAFPNCYRFLDWVKPQIKSVHPAGSWPYPIRAPVEDSCDLLALLQSSCSSYYSRITSLIDSFLSRGSYVFVLIKFLLQMKYWTPVSFLASCHKYISYVSVAVTKHQAGTTWGIEGFLSVCFVCLSQGCIGISFHHSREGFTVVVGAWDRANVHIMTDQQAEEAGWD